ncbi:hypothetical protein C8R47DRAFT_1178408 [Mycena vitilis]|nr:hypothetical protein C8R47DRAFT_1178408 [Mycena vitilis]
MEMSVAALLFASAVRAAVTPIVASNTSYGSLISANLTRDSCSSSLWSNNVLWVCRDTEQISDGNPVFPVVASTASFSSMPTSPNSPQPLVLSSPQDFGALFYQLGSDECPPYGACSDGTRWEGWPDTGPVVTFRGPKGTVNAYAFIIRAQLSGLSVINTPNYSLYRVSSNSAGPIPNTSMEISDFWSSEQIGYGSAASVVRNGLAYLYGATPDGRLALARAKPGFLGSLEDKKLYSYYVDGAWTSIAPASNVTSIALTNTSSAQGTIYWSPKWQSYVWIGGDGFPNANFFISTAPKPEGPWTVSTQFYVGAVGVGSLPAYSAVAHPSLTDGTGNYIFISWTRTIDNPTGSGTIYEQPLVRVDWR